VGYTLGDIFLFANFEQLKYNADGITVASFLNEYKRKAWSVGVKWNIATGYVGAQYIQAQDGTCSLVSGASCSASETGARMVGLGYFTFTESFDALEARAEWPVNAGDQVEVVSAGSHPKPIHPNAIKVLAEVGIDISAARSKLGGPYFASVGINSEPKWIAMAERVDFRKVSDLSHEWIVGWNRVRITFIDVDAKNLSQNCGQILAVSLIARVALFS
jgi:hypothetical protein